MRIIIDIGHPGHVHLFKNLARLLIQGGAEVLFTVRDKEFEIELLRAEKFNFINLGKHYRSITGKLWGLFKYGAKMVACGRKFKPTLFVSHGSIHAAHAAFLLGSKHLSLEDSGNMEQIVFYKPFTDLILTPKVLPNNLGPRQVRYDGYHEIAYLHPDFFTPDPKVYRWLGIGEGTPYAILRFVSWTSTHDVGQMGLSGKDKAKLALWLSKRLKVFISSEERLPPELDRFRLKLPSEKFHHALSFASMAVSEGSTTAMEAALLGTPTIYPNTNPGSNCLDLAKYGLIFHTTESGRVFSLADEILLMDREAFRAKGRALFLEKVNLTKHMHQLILDRYQPPMYQKA